MRRAMIFAPLLLFVAVFCSNAQITTASISGIISDSTGAVIPSIEATATQQETQFTRSAVGEESALLTAIMSTGIFWLRERPAIWVRHRKRSPTLEASIAHC